MAKLHERLLRPEGLLRTGEDPSGVPIAEGEPAPSDEDEGGQLKSTKEVSRGGTTLAPTSGVRSTAARSLPAALAPAGFSWIQKQVAQSPTGLRGCPARVQEEARRRAREDGQRALCRFERLSASDRDEIIAAALERFVRAGQSDPAWEGNPEPYFRHAVRCEAIALTERRFQDAQRGNGPLGSANTGELDFALLWWLDQARRRTETLHGLERRVFFANAALDSIAAEHEVLKVALYTAIALRLRLNSVHKHMSRARQKLFYAKGRDTIEWADAWKYLEPPSDELARAARAYLAACRARGTGDAVVRFAEAHEEHRQRSNLFKEQSARALQGFRAFVDALNTSKLRPRDVQADLIEHCVELGIDHRVIETRIKSGQSWVELLLSVDVKRPTADERDAWRSLLSSHALGAEVAARWTEAEERANQADLARAALNQAYKGFLEAAAESPDDLIRKRDEFLSLVDAK
jgi:hypothetical protein